MDVSVMLQIIQVCDSLFPIGAFTMSNGLETFVAKGKLHTEQQLREYMDSYLALLPYNDLAIMMLAYENGDNWDYIKELDAYGFCLKSPMEVRSGSQKLCRRFLKTSEAFGWFSRLRRYQELVQNKQCYGIYAIGMGLYTKEVKADIEQAAAVYVYSLLSAIVTNSVKTIPLSQLVGQKILHQELSKVEECIRCARTVDIHHLGVGGAEFDIEAMNHETLYSRMYIS